MKGTFFSMKMKKQRGFAVYHSVHGFAGIFMLIIGLVIGGAIVGGFYYGYNQEQKNKLKAINSFEDCAAKYPVMESYPAQCNTPDGRHFVQELSEEEKKKLVPPEISPSPVGDETASWKTYVSTNLNFSVKYPSDINVDDKQNINSAIFNINQKQVGFSGFPKYYISVIPDNASAKSADLYNYFPIELINKFYNLKVGDRMQTNQGDLYAEFFTFTRLSNIYVDGEDALVMENNKVWEGEEGLFDRRVFVEHKGFVYEIGSYYKLPIGLMSFQTFLSTFKFN